MYGVEIGPRVIGASRAPSPCNQEALNKALGPDINIDFIE